MSYSFQECYVIILQNCVFKKHVPKGTELALDFWVLFPSTFWAVFSARLRVHCGIVVRNNNSGIFSQEEFWIIMKNTQLFEDDAPTDYEQFLLLKIWSILVDRSRERASVQKHCSWMHRTIRTRRQPPKISEISVFRVYPSSIFLMRVIVDGMEGSSYKWGILET